MQFSKLNDNTIRITETKPIVADYKLDFLIDKKIEIESRISELENQKLEYEKELKGITDLIAECEKLNIKPLISEDESVQLKKEV